jgi:hypothetical protein
MKQKTGTKTTQSDEHEINTRQSRPTKIERSQPEKVFATAAQNNRRHQGAKCTNIPQEQSLNATNDLYPNIQRHNDTHNDTHHKRRVRLKTYQFCYTKSSSRN